MSCAKQQQLINEVLAHLLRISDLSRATAEAVRNRNEDLTRQLDKDVEGEIGSKERALGRLRQHRQDHGC